MSLALYPSRVRSNEVLDGMLGDPGYLYRSVELRWLDLKPEVHSVPIAGVCHLYVMPRVALNSKVPKSICRSQDDIQFVRHDTGEARLPFQGALQRNQRSAEIRKCLGKDMHIIAPRVSARLDRDCDVCIAVPCGEVYLEGTCAVSEAEWWHAV